MGQHNAHWWPIKYSSLVCDNPILHTGWYLQMYRNPWIHNGYLISGQFTSMLWVACSEYLENKANLWDLIAATGLVIPNWIQIVNFSARVTVKFDGWPRKTIGHFFYTMSSFVHHFKSIGEFKLDLQSRNTQFGLKLVICYPMWPWYLMDDLGKQ